MTGRGQRCPRLRAGGGGAVRAGASGSFVRAVHPTGAVSLRSLRSFSVPTRAPASRPGPAPLILRCSAGPCQALVAKFSTAQPNSDGQTFIISWPPAGTGHPLARYLPSGRLPPRCPVCGVRRDTCVAAGRVVPWGPPAVVWFEGSDPHRSLALAGSRDIASPRRSWEGYVPSWEGADFVVRRLEDWS